MEILSCDALDRSPTKIFSTIADRVNTPEIVINMEEGEHYALVQELVEKSTFAGAKTITVDGVRAEYAHGWGLVRASNTMPAITLRFEADSSQDLHDIQQRFKEHILRINPKLVLPF